MRAFCLSLLLLIAVPMWAADTIHGVVVDPDDRPVGDVLVRLVSAGGLTVTETRTGLQGEFELTAPPRGDFRLTAESGGLGGAQQRLDRSAGDRIRLQLSLLPANSAVTVSASRSFVEQPATSAVFTDVRETGDLRTKPLPTIGHAIDDSPGVLLQQTSTAQVSPFLRGLTGYQVLNLVDGVRFNNSTFRSGPNQYLAFVGPEQAQRIETSLGPSSSQYGSDSLGGTIQILTPEVRFAAQRRQVHGSWNAFGSSADTSGGTDGRVMAGTARMAVSAGLSGTRHNDLRTGGGEDSRNILTRFFGLSRAQAAGLTGDRLQDTAFSQWGADAKVAMRLGGNQSVTLLYQQSAQDDSRNYKDLWGGLGRLQSALTPQGLRFGYARYEKTGLGVLDSLSATLSANSQRDGSVRQNLRTTDSITTEESQVNVFGYSAQATSHAGNRNALVFGGEYYNEFIASARRVLNPVTRVSVSTRPLYPDDSRYRTGGAFVQDRFEVTRRLLATFGGRWTQVGYRNQADPFGTRASSQTFSDWTFHSALTLQVHPALSVVGLVGRGFRAPNANDLGAIGLNDLGFEIPASDAIPARAFVGASAGEAATSSGRPVEKLRAEQLMSYELGLRLRVKKLEARVQVFDSELYSPIVRRTLLFARNSVPSTLSGLAVTAITPTPAQAAQGLVTVATGVDPRAVKAFVNDGRSRYYGSEGTAKLRLGSGWSVEGGYSWILGRDLNPNRNIRRLPPAQGSVALQNVHTRYWWRTGLLFAGAQQRLSGGDVDDERIGASRSRADIANVFLGARVSPYISQGVFTPTGETLRQIQDRLLPGLADSARVALYAGTAGWVTWNFQSGYSLTDHVGLTAGLSNVLDRNYRRHGSGIDAPGIDAFVGLRLRF